VKRLSVLWRRSALHAEKYKQGIEKNQYMFKKAARRVRCANPAVQLF
jgi:hypothetical protein